jgi:hypothetical protein
MKQLLLGLTLFCGLAFAQTKINPDCAIPFTFTATGSTQNLTCGNNTQGVVNWTMAYSSTGFSALSLVVQSAPDNHGVPGTWVAFAGTVCTSTNCPGSSGVNPNTATTSTYTFFYGYYPWNRVTLSSVTGTGTVKGVLYGFLNNPATGGSGAGGGGGSGCTSPCTVIQPTASLLNDTSVLTLFNGSAQSKAINCPNVAAVTVSASGDTQIIAASGSTQVYICKIDFSASAGSNFSFHYGTGSNCATGDTAISGVYQNVLTYSSPWDANAPLVFPASKAVCLNFVGSITAGGTVTYAQF